MEIKTCFASEEEKREYVNLCETNFVRSVNECTESLLGGNSIKFITLSGPTCSGKTTAAKILTDVLSRYGKRVGLISIDDFYLERRILDSRERLDYDSIDTIDIERLKAVVDGIERGDAVEIPIYSFKSGEREGYRNYDSKDSITIFEGIQAVYPGIRELFNPKDTKSIYISVEGEVNVNGIAVSSRTVRLFRRIVRDFEKRSSSPEFTLRLWESVVTNEDACILPFENECDYRINSLMGYEICLIKDPLLRMLDMIDESSSYFEYAQKLKRIFDGTESLSVNYLPKDSLYREFVG